MLSCDNFKEQLQKKTVTFYFEHCELQANQASMCFPWNTFYFKNME